ncbi:hypothetical protein ACN9TE_00130 [Lactococcus lactis]
MKLLKSLLIATGITALLFLSVIGLALILKAFGAVVLLIVLALIIIIAYTILFYYV